MSLLLLGLELSLSLYLSLSRTLQMLGKNGRGIKSGFLDIAHLRVLP